MRQPGKEKRGCSIKQLLRDEEEGINLAVQTLFPKRYCSRGRIAMRKWGNNLPGRSHVRKFSFIRLFIHFNLLDKEGGATEVDELASNGFQHKIFHHVLTNLLLLSCLQDSVFVSVFK